MYPNAVRLEPIGNNLITNNIHVVIIIRPTVISSQLHDMNYKHDKCCSGSTAFPQCFMKACAVLLLTQMLIENIM